MTTIAGLFNRQDRSKDKFITVLRPHVDIMYRMAFRWTGEKSAAEDLVQDVLVKLTDKVDEIAALENPRPWLLKVVYRQFVDEHRRRKRRLELVSSDTSGAASDAEDGADDRGIEAATPEGQNPATAVGNIQELQHALAQLEPGQRDVILLHDAEGYSDSETAKILDISKGTVKSRLHRARHKLKKILAGGTIARSASC